MVKERKAVFLLQGVCSFGGPMPTLGADPGPAQANWEDPAPPQLPPW